MNILGFIPARSGSKGVVHKNIKTIEGVPLLAFSYFTARSCMEQGLLSEILVSTDSREYLETLRPLGYHTEYLRPAALASDSSPTLDAVLHGLEWYRSAGTEFDAVMILQPTSPFRTPEHIEHAIRLLAENPQATCVTGITQLEDAHPARIKKLLDGKWVTDWCEHTVEPEPSRRQDLTPPAFIRNGTIYLVPAVTLRRGLIRGERVLGMEMHAANSANIDSHKDFLLAKAALSYDAYAEPLSFFRPLIQMYNQRKG